MTSYILFDGASNEIGAVPIQYIRTSGIEIYEGPGTDLYRSQLYSVSAWDYVEYSPVYTYSATTSAWVWTSVSGYRNQYWLSGSYPSVSYATIGTSGVLSAVIEKIGGSITSIDIGPYSRNIPYTLTNGKAYIVFNRDDKLFININNTPSTPLCLFADPLKPAIPTSGNVVYYKPGIHSIGKGFSSFTSDTTFYFDGGSYVKGNFKIYPKNNVKFIGPGILAGDDYYEEATTFTWYRTLNGPPYYTEGVARDYVALRGGHDYNELVVDNPPSGIEVNGLTLVRHPWHSAKGINKINHFKWISPWIFSTDGPNLWPDISTSTCSMENSFLFNADDSFFLDRNYTASGERLLGDMLYRRCYSVTHNNGPMLLTYYSNYYNDYFPGAKTKVASAIDIDMRYFAARQSTDPNYNDANGVIKAYLSNPNSAASGPVWGYFNAILSGIRVEGNTECPLFILASARDPYATGNLPAGALSGVQFIDVSASMNANYVSASIVSGGLRSLGRQFTDILFRNLTINGTKVDHANYRQFFRLGTYSDPYNYPENNLKFIQDSYSKIKYKINDIWRDTVAWVKVDGKWRATDTFFNDSTTWK